MKVLVNDDPVDLDGLDPEMPLLWLLRDQLKLAGTKFGCGIAQCGACTILIDDVPMRSCQTRVQALEDGASITTIEGLANDDGTLSKLQQAWVDYDVPQCGYCQSGQLLAATALLQETPNPSDEDIKIAMSGNICRCGTYNRIFAAIKSVAHGETNAVKTDQQRAKTHEHSED